MNEQSSSTPDFSTADLRSPRETILGWAELPRYIDKVRLHLAGLLPQDYVTNLGSGGFDNALLLAMGVSHEQMVAIIRNARTDGRVAHELSLLLHASGKSRSDANAFTEQFLNRPRPDDAATLERFAKRKADYGLADRNDVRRFTDLVDADEGRRVAAQDL